MAPSRALPPKAPAALQCFLPCSLLWSLSSVLLWGSAAGYSQDRALQFADLAWAAYAPSEELLDWSCDRCLKVPGVTDVQVCEGTTSKAYVAVWEDQCLVSFEGTKNTPAFVKDLQFWESSVAWPSCSGCRVHGGFLDVWNGLQDCVFVSLIAAGCSIGSKLRTTGHSLGAAVNALAMMELAGNGWQVTESYDFGMPRTGDLNFANAFNNRFGDRSYRVTHRKDPVVQVPPDHSIVDWHFAHKVPEVFYPGNLSSGYKVCTVRLDNSCSHQYWNIAVDLLNVQDHLHYLENSDSVREVGSNATASQRSSLRGGTGLPVQVVL